MNKILQNIYYDLKPFIPRKSQIYFRKIQVSYLRQKTKKSWPINHSADGKPENWQGWPDNKKFAFVLMHDVEDEKGLKRCRQLMNIEKELGFRSSFNFVPAKYHTSKDFQNELVNNGFEVGVQGLSHDGKLYKSYKKFKMRASKINQFLEDWQAVGFRSPAMHHRLDWIYHLNIEYDSSTFDTDPFEPQSGGVNKIFPFFLENKENPIVELPYTLAQDFTLFVLMEEQNSYLWEKKLDWIAEKGAMALLTTHPDYKSFDKTNVNFDEYPIEYYINFLKYIKSKYSDTYWNALPREMAQFWKSSYI